MNDNVTMEDSVGLMDIAKANTNAFIEEWESAESIQHFLQETNYIPMNSTDMRSNEKDSLMKTTFDIDGLVLLIRHLEDLKLPLYELHLDLNKNITQIYHKVKKHYRLSDYSIQWRKALASSHGLVISRTQGYEIIIGLIPAATITPNFTKLDFRKCKNYFQAVKQLTEHKLRMSPPKDKTRPTLKNNSLYDISFWRVIAPDQKYLLSVIDESLRETEAPDDWKCVLFISRFGQKETSPIDIRDVCKLDSIVDISVHAAVTLDLSYGGMHFIWARSGLQMLLGNRGRLFPVLSLSEAANFQSNLDGRNLDVSRRLLDLSKWSDKVTFIQLYADIIHRRPDRSRLHPVSGSIVCGSILHPQSTRKLNACAESYLNTMKDNCSKLVDYSHGRLEIVTNITTQDMTTSVLNPKDLLNMKNVYALLDDYPLVLPFKSAFPTVDQDFFQVIQNIATHIVTELEKVFRDCKGKCGYKAFWQSYQYELALEKFFYGKYPSYLSRNLAIHLGPGTEARDEYIITHMVVVIEEL